MDRGTSKSLHLTDSSYTPDSIKKEHYHFADIGKKLMFRTDLKSSI